jgi:polar amino acid transport system substrate-binding protein
MFRFLKGNFRRAVALALTVVTAISFTACGSTASGANSGTDGKTKIVIATTGTGPEPSVYQDSNGNLTGYDIDLVTEVFSRLPQYEISFQTTEFSSIFAGLDAGYYQVGLNNMGYKTERGEKYLVSDVVRVEPHGILVKDTNTDINSVWDLAGHKTIVSPSSYNATTFEAYNASNDKKINLQYTETTDNVALQISDGTIDFYYFDVTTLELYIKNSGLTDLKIVEVPLEDSNKLGNTIAGELILFPKGYEQLQEDFNKAFEAALADGTVAKLSQKYYGNTGDYLTTDYISEVKEYIKNDVAGAK